jgi:hypothetical protein
MARDPFSRCSGDIEEGANQNRRVQIVPQTGDNGYLTFGVALICRGRFWTIRARVNSREGDSLPVQQRAFFHFLQDCRLPRRFVPDSYGNLLRDSL